MGLIFRKDDDVPGCAGCGECAEACTCPSFLTPYSIALLKRFASGCSSDRVRIDLLTAARSLTERNRALQNVFPPDHMG